MRCEDVSVGVFLMKSYQEMLEEKIHWAEYDEDFVELSRLEAMLDDLLAREQEEKELEKIFNASSSNI